MQSELKKINLVKQSSHSRHRFIALLWRISADNVVCHMMTSSNGNTIRVAGPSCGDFTGPGEFPAQRPVTRSFDVFFDLRLNKQLSKQWWGWWFETPSWSLWRHCNEKLWRVHGSISQTFGGAHCPKQWNIFWSLVHFLFQLSNQATVLYMSRQYSCRDAVCADRIGFFNLCIVKYILKRYGLKKMCKMCFRHRCFYVACKVVLRWQSQINCLNHPGRLTHLCFFFRAKPLSERMLDSFNFNR